MSKPWRVLLPERIDPAGPNDISDIASFDDIADVGNTPEALRSRISRYDGIILRSAPLTRDVLTEADRLKVIAKHGIGLDNVDLETATEKGIIVCNTPRANTRSVAEATITHLLATRFRISYADEQVRAGNWNVRSDWEALRRHTVESETLGLFGFGAIAREVARIARGLGMDCIAYDPYVDPSDLTCGTEIVDDRRLLFERANVVSVHAPLTEETKGAIGYDELKQLGPHGYVINTARGGIINESDLVAALENGVMRGAGLDVLEREPPREGDPLLQRDDIIFSPHASAVTYEATEQMSRTAAMHVRTVYEGGVPESAVTDHAG